MKATNVVKILSALAQESRLAVFRLLIRKLPGGIPAGELAEKMGLPAATMSFHLKELSRVGLISARRESRSLIYTANYAHMEQVINFLLENCCIDNGGNC